ncbi:hypothetical protein GUJ93_ZPchr0002g23391 [Zizania palustris]|uniref:Uncharacterized protein n=1 Tax=Zizania palustris TaxID=103762 RepID=A0A8J5RXK0_ZIZPA|nr:hypothetical protein GUJ93_ZPchr0002g23391 [Zizania palustris]
MSKQKPPKKFSHSFADKLGSMQAKAVLNMHMINGKKFRGYRIHRVMYTDCGCSSRVSLRHPMARQSAAALRLRCEEASRLACDAMRWLISPSLHVQFLFSLLLA